MNEPNAINQVIKSLGDAGHVPCRLPRFKCQASTAGSRLQPSRSASSAAPTTPPARSSLRVPTSPTRASSHSDPDTHTTSPFTGEYVSGQNVPPPPQKKSAAITPGAALGASALRARKAKTFCELAFECIEIGARPLRGR